MMSYRAKDHYRDAAVADTYDAERFASRKGRIVDRREQGLIRALIQRAGLRPPASLVDIPCGTGRLAMSLAAEGFQVTGVDVSEQMLERAVARWSDAPADRRPTVVVADAESLPFEDDAFDVVVSLRLAGHLPPATRVGVLREFGRVSRGHVIVAFYHRASVQGVLRRQARRGLSWNPVSLADIDGELDRAGLRRVDRRFMLPFVSETVVVLAEPV
jgi:ubiquinone/menaquinone biosynthesis C-methylase UbiE